VQLVESTRVLAEEHACSWLKVAVHLKKASLLFFESKKAGKKVVLWGENDWF